MKQRERLKKDRRTERDEVSHSRKKASENSYDQVKEPDDVIGHRVRPSIDGHASMLAGATDPAQRASLVRNLQQTYGNRYVQRMMESGKVQAKLTVSQPDDKYEQEADKVADTVTRNSGLQTQRQEEEEIIETKRDIRRQEEEEDVLPKLLQRQEDEEELQMKSALQRQEEEEIIEAKRDVQRQTEEDEEEEEVQPKADLQRQEEEEDVLPKLLQRQEDEELLQGKGMLLRQADEEVEQEVTQSTTDTQEEAVSDVNEAAEAVTSPPERGQIQELVLAAEKCMMQGQAAEAENALREAADKALEILKAEVASFDVELVTEEAISALLKAAEEVMMLGGDESATEEAMNKALEASEAQLEATLNVFQADPNEETARQMLDKAAQVQLFGGNADAAVQSFFAWKEGEAAVNTEESVGQTGTQSAASI